MSEVPYRQAAKPVDDPVTSIRVASTLLERFRVLLATGSTSSDGLALAIREAQQIYPEIWRHLDDARRMLAARDRDLANYDSFPRAAASSARRASPIRRPTKTTGGSSRRRCSARCGPISRSRPRRSRCSSPIG